MKTALRTRVHRTELAAADTTRTKAIAVLVASAIFVAALWSAPGADAASNGRGRPATTTTTSTSTAPRTPTWLTVHPAVHWTTYSCGFDYCGSYGYTVAFSARLATQDGLPVVGRVVHLSESTSGACAAMTNATGLATCITQSHEPLGTVFGYFSGDAEYDASSGSFPVVIAEASK